MDDRNSSDDCYSSDFEDEPEPGTTTCKINLENDVSITAPNSLYSILNEYITTKWTANEKNNSLQFLNLPLESTLDGFAEFCCCQLDSFGIVIHSKKMSAIVNPLGTEIDIGDSCACILKFDKDCVKSNENFRYTVHTPDVEFSRFGYTSTRHVKHVSDKVNFEYDRAKFLKPIKVVVSLTYVPLMHQNESQIEILLVGYKNGSASIVKSMKTSADAIYSGSLHGYDGVSLAAVLKIKEAKISKIELTNELNWFYGSRILGNILVYFLKRNSSTLRLKVSCCRAEHAKLLIVKEQQEGNFLIHKSENLFLTPYQRFKIRPAGCIGLKPGGGSHLWMLFLSVSSDNTSTFQVKINRIMGGSPNAILCFSTDTDSRNYTEITKVEFNLDSLPFLRNRQDHEENQSKADTKLNTVKITKNSDLKSIEAGVDQGASLTHHLADCKTVLSKTESKHSIVGGLILSNPTLERYEQ
ncbi:unnamed protein product [Mytilus coruscus]|uniref:Uncharacterized protein n=1 Tax=Mytilus coruscus TaxID=42192 RepID=A0A6J8E5Y3_MYTCO|nr:unnamed protein product [Mytilus coruscus]